MKKMQADKGSDALTGAMIVREFLTQRLAPSKLIRAPCGTLRAQRMTFGCTEGT